MVTQSEQYQCYEVISKSRYVDLNQSRLQVENNDVIAISDSFDKIDEYVRDNHYGGIHTWEMVGMIPGFIVKSSQINMTTGQPCMIEIEGMEGEVHSKRYYKFHKIELGR